jgi:hypothetical protein
MTANMVISADDIDWRAAQIMIEKVRMKKIMTDGEK